MISIWALPSLTDSGNSYFLGEYGTMDNIIEGALNKIGAMIVGGIIALILSVIGWEKYKRNKKVHQKQKAGNRSIQIQRNASGEDIVREQEAGDDAIQVQTEGKRDV